MHLIRGMMTIASGSEGEILAWSHVVSFLCLCVGDMWKNVMEGGKL